MGRGVPPAPSSGIQQTELGGVRFVSPAGVGRVASVGIGEAALSGMAGWDSQEAANETHNSPAGRLRWSAGGSLRPPHGRSGGWWAWRSKSWWGWRALLCPGGPAGLPRPEELHSNPALPWWFHLAGPASLQRCGDPGSPGPPSPRGPASFALCYIHSLRARHIGAPRLLPPALEHLPEAFRSALFLGLDPGGREGSWHGRETFL